MTATVRPSERPPTSADGSADPRARMSRRTLFGVLAGLFLGILLGALDNTIVVTALPSIVRDLHDVNGLPFVVSAYLMAQTIAMPLFGKLSDHYGRRGFFLLGLGIFMAGSVLSGLSQNLNELIAFRAIQGVGSGAFFPVANSIIAVLYGPQERARLSGVFGATFGIAIVMGPLIGSYIVDSTTWRWIFYINLPVGLVGVGLIAALLGPLRGGLSHEKFDWPGAALLAGWVAPLMFAFLQTSNGWAWTDPRTLALFAGGLALLVAFLYRESTAPEPMLPLSFFGRRLLAAVNALSFLRGIVMIASITYLSIFVSFVLGGTADTVRDVLYGMLVPMIAGSILGGQLLPRTGYRPLMVGGMALMTLGALLLTQISASTQAVAFTFTVLPSGLLLALIPTGFGVGVTFAAALLAVQYAAPARQIGVASSVVQFMGNLGGAIGISLLGAYQSARYTALTPRTLPAGCAQPSPANPACLPYLAAAQNALVTSMQDLFWGVLVVSVAALAVSFVVSGRLPSRRPGEVAAEPALGPG